ncbi:MAG: DMT family transporter [Pyramidobacter sp.]|nr:DMT family transporter [Pyramidobacter sp.]
MPFCDSRKKPARAQAELLLAAVIVARSGSFLLSKIALRSMAPLNLLAVRFLMAFAFLALLFWRRLAKADFGTVWRGLVIGATFFALDDVFGVASAMLYALAIIITDRVTRGRDAFVIGIVQVGGMALFASLTALAFVRPALPASGTEWLCVAGLALVCSGFGFTLQPVAQSGATAERAGLFCALSPVSAGFLGWFVLGERLGVRGLIGAALVMTGILIPHFWRDHSAAAQKSS